MLFAGPLRKQYLTSSALSGAKESGRRRPTEIAKTRNRCRVVSFVIYPHPRAPMLEYASPEDRVGEVRDIKSATMCFQQAPGSDGNLVSEHRRCVHSDKR